MHSTSQSDCRENVFASFERVTASQRACPPSSSIVMLGPPTLSSQSGDQIRQVCGVVSFVSHLFPGLRRSIKFHGRAWAGKEARRWPIEAGDGVRSALRFAVDTRTAPDSVIDAANAGDGERSGRCGTGAKMPDPQPPLPLPPATPSPTASPAEAWRSERSLL